jgi:DNA polymerase-3 subunit beta
VHITCNSQHLGAELRLLNKIVPAKPAIQILGHLLLRAEMDFKLYATDLEVGLLTPCRARINEPGAVALPAAKLLQLVEQFPDAEVTIHNDKITCGTFTSKMQAISADQFPTPAEVSGPTLQLNGPALRQMILRTRYVISESGSKYVLRGALLSLTAAGAAMAATDGKRLALATMQYAGDDHQLIIPTATLDMLGSQNGDVTLTLGDNHLFFEADGRLLISGMLDSKFPSYARIIPRDNPHTLTVERSALSAALRRILIVAELNCAVYCQLAENQLTLKTSSVEVGNADETVRISYIGPPMTLCVNGRYLLDFLEVAQTVTIMLKDPDSAMLLTDGVDHLAVVMTMRA